ncbi:hypothetical protein CDD81_4673 [Ophiocordyceps australis]|uniref:Carboxylic ester hydrolase n=1 Tax=Ophiocordyceps australis TaxID=1399860 RepID=A0A2C5XTM4_9HYPO|nr:hypothetical protein CDD81_4673 [Ophiocordyceps australis]
MIAQPLVLLGAFYSSVCLGQTASLPIIDLGYQRHQASWYNRASDSYNFANIRYAEPPVGELRFAAPVRPQGRNAVVQNGSQGGICPQAWAAWGIASHDFGMAYLHGNTSDYNYTRELDVMREAEPQILAADSSAEFSEDCLFLDVVVPRRILERGSSSGAPVFVWLHGGGFVYGHKNDSAVGGDPAGLMRASQLDGSDGFIFVAPNYRLGAFGWLAGASVDAVHAKANAGLDDQRLALEWVQSHIHCFGGDAKQVTVGGLSAGGSSILHHLTARRGKSRVPFQRAFLNSPGFQPFASALQVENRTQTFLHLANVSSLAQARQLSWEALRQANGRHVASSRLGYLYGPSVDGDYVPSLPGSALARGELNKALDGSDVDVLMSYAVLEGGEYNAPWVRTDDDFEALLRNVLLPWASDEAIQAIVAMYPGQDAVRTMRFIGDFAFSCSVNWLSQARGNKTYTYMYDMYPGFHGWDVPYTFYGTEHPLTGTAQHQEPAMTLQRYITNFVKTGNPNGPDLPPFPPQGANASINVMGQNGWTLQRDSTANPRCQWIQKWLLA